MGNGNNNGKNGKTPLVVQEKERIRKIVTDAPFLKKDEYYDKEAENTVKEKLKEKLKLQAKRFLSGPAYFRDFVEQVISKDGDIAYAFVVGSYANLKNYQEIMREHDIMNLTEEDLSNIRIPKDIDILIVYEDDKTKEEEANYVRNLEEKSPKVKAEGDAEFKYEIHAVKIEEFYEYVRADYNKVKDMTPEQVAKFMEDVSRRHELQVPVNSVKIYQKASPDVKDEGAELEYLKQRGETEKNLGAIKEKTGHPRTERDMMEFWSFYAKRAKELFPEEFEAISKEFERFKDIYAI